MDQTLDHLTPTVHDMVQVQRHSGMRPSEVCLLRKCDIEKTEGSWIYRPHEHRTEHRSHALAGGKSLAQVRDCAGHSNVAITSIYVHVSTDDDGEVGNLFDAA